MLNATVLNTAELVTTGSVRRIGVFTGNRAEYGLLVPVLHALLAEPEFNLCLIVAGDHYLTGTLSEITADGWPIALGLEPNDQTQAVLTQPHQTDAARMSLICAQVQQDFSQQMPLDLAALIILGDRYESCAAALTARLANIPILHIGGGDETQGGCVDDCLRDVITRLAGWHAVSCQASAERLQRLGVDPNRIQLVGSLVCDNIARLSLIPRNDLLTEYGLSGKHPVVLFTQHPIPAEGEAAVQHLRDSITALASLPVDVIATYPNRDGFEKAILQVITESTQHDANIHWIPNLGRLRYLSWMAACDVVVGNTSSGLIETPYFYKPSLTIGPRQAGRTRGDNVWSCEYGIEPVRQALVALLDNPTVPEQCRQALNPFGSQLVAPQILAGLKQLIYHN